MSVNEDNLSRVGPSDPEQQKSVPIKCTIALKTWTDDNFDQQSGPECTFETRPWDFVWSEIKGQQIPLLSLVNSDTVEDMLDSIAMASWDDDNKTSKPRTYEIVRVRGRTVEVRSHQATFPSWKDLAPHLMGTGRCAEDFSVVSSSKLYVRLKTAAMVAAEEQLVSNGDAMGFEDWAFGSCQPSGLRSFLHTLTDVPSKPVTLARKKRKRPDGNKLLVLKCMEKKFPTAMPTMAELFEEIGEQIECPKPKRRGEYFRKAVAQLADTEVNPWLFRHEGDRVSLSALVTGDV
jgi:hypothetical protein